MAVSVSPSPADGPLSARGPNVTLTVSAGRGCTLTAFVSTPVGNPIRIESMNLGPGSHRIVLSLPPGGVPSGSQLILVLDEPSGQKTVVRYALA